MTLPGSKRWLGPYGKIWLFACALSACGNGPAGDGTGAAAGGGGGSLVSGEAGATGLGGTTNGLTGAGGSSAGGAAATGTGGRTAGTAGSGGSGGSNDQGGTSGGGGVSGLAGAGGRGGHAGTGGTAGAHQGTGGTPADGGAPDGARGGTGGGGPVYMPCPATGSPCVILPLGDSITQGFLPPQPGMFLGGYRVELFHQALSHNKAITFVGSQTNGPAMVDNQAFPTHHEGHGGYTIAGISGAITDDAIANYHPNVVLLMIGTNDVNGNNALSQAPSRLLALMTDIVTRAPNALLVVSTIIPIANATANQRVQQYNGAIPDLVKMLTTQGKHVILVDSYAEFAKNANYASALMGDSLHPNTTGYTLLGQTWYAAIGPALP